MNKLYIYHHTLLLLACWLNIQHICNIQSIFSFPDLVVPPAEIWWAQTNQECKSQQVMENTQSILICMLAEAPRRRICLSKRARPWKTWGHLRTEALPAVQPLKEGCNWLFNNEICGVFQVAQQVYVAIVLTNTGWHWSPLQPISTFIFVFLCNYSPEFVRLSVVGPACFIYLNLNEVLILLLKLLMWQAAGWRLLWSEAATEKQNKLDFKTLTVIQRACICFIQECVISFTIILHTF